MSNLSHDSETSSLATAAERYAELGLLVFPCHPQRKEPMAEHGYLDAVADMSQIDAWWSKTPDANIGLPCKPNGLLVLDVDRHVNKVTGEIVDGLATLAELSGGAEIITPTADTGGGGIHYLFRAPDWTPSGKAGPGLDVKYNGYILVWPSVHPDGPLYLWRDGLAPWEVELAEVPDWLSARIRPQQRPACPKQPEGASWLIDPEGRLSPEEVALAALTHIPADEYDVWVKVGLALHALCLPVTDWDCWSQSSPGKYKPGECAKKWLTFAGSDKPEVALGWLVNKAREVEPDFLKTGWRSEARSASTSIHSKATPSGQASLEPAAEAKPVAEVTADPVGRRHCRPGDHRCDDIGNAERFTELYGDRLRWSNDRRVWLWYNGVRWAVDESSRALEAACAVARSILQEAFDADDNTRTELIKHAAHSAKRGQLEAMLHLARKDLTVRSADLDADDYVLNCTNGTIDLRTGTLRPHDPADLITCCTNVPYTPDADQADTPGAIAWRQFRAGLTKDDTELEAYLHRAAGYSLTGDPCEEVFFLAYGRERTGKGTFLATLVHHLGDYAEQANFNAFLRKGVNSDLQPDLARLQGKRFVASSETNAGRTFAEGVVKHITGNEPISTTAKYQAPVTWVPKFTLWLSANDLPNARHGDGGLWRRLKLLPFAHQVPETETDIWLKKRLRDTAGEAVLAWLVRGCLAWQRDGLGTCAAVDTASKHYRQKMDLLADWLNECCEVDASNQAWFTPTSLLYQSYCDWHGGTAELSQRQMGQQLTARNLLGTKRRVDGTPQHGYVGICLAEHPLADVQGVGDPGSSGDHVDRSTPLPERDGGHS